ncbi:acetolactate synthase large subunit [Agarilytica rhodophyticola]|uniref:acetolactate synthase large subunit n=1 Tax=Agarilytica rhodophyticola TaxID=1737490 RepID=UPI000B3471FF|nr:acetolactate synthase large subunit [Agarilytica rhodophyticola]
MKASDLMVKCLEEEGIEYIFGVPGEENADFMMSLESSDDIRFVLTRHEQGAAFMAEIYGRLTGSPAACLGTLGPGATNLITGVADANMDRAPMLVITGQGSTSRLHKESHQIMDVVKMFEPVTKWASTIVHPDTIPEIVRKSVRIARSEKPGAVLIELPEDVAEHDTPALPMKPIRFRRPVAGQEMIAAAVEKIRQAKRPVILAGNGCVRKRASEYLRKFCDDTGIGVLNTFMAKGAVDYDKPYCLYTIGLGAKDIGTCAIDAADLVISIGFDMVEYHPKLWNAEGNKSIIHIDFTPAEVDKHYHPEIELVGDIAHSLSALVHEFEDIETDFDLGQQQATRADMKSEIDNFENEETEGTIKPQKVLLEVQKIYGDDGLLLSDVGAHKMWIARHYHCKTPNGCLIPNGFCSMGFALPGAIAASLVDPDRKIMGIAGDAGFMMNVQEMETATRLNSNITMMVWEDNAYGLIAWKQWAQFGKHTDLSFNNPDWEALAKAFAWQYQAVPNSKDLQQAMQNAIDHKGPSLIVIPIDYDENKKLTARLGELSCSI